MAESSGIRAGKAFVELSLQDKFSKAIDAAAKKLKDVGQTITDIGKKTLAIGSAITAPLLIAAQRFAAMGEEMQKAAEKTGVGVEQLSALKYAADQNGVAFESLVGGLGKMQKTLFAAAGGSDEARKSLAALGLTVEDLKNLKPDEQFQRIAQKISELGDATAITGATLAIFGKSGADLIPLMLQGAAGIKALEDRARSLGIVMSKEDAEAGKAFSQTLKDLWDQVQALTFSVGAAVAQALSPFATALKPLLRDTIEWAQAHRPLIIALLTTGAALIAAGGGLIGVGLGIKAVGVALSGITSGFKIVASVVGLLSNPIVLVIIALAALTAWFVATSENGAKLLGWLGDKFNLLATTAQTAFGGIADALKAGDISLAMQILWTGLKLAWIQGTQELQNKWIEFKGEVTKVAIETFYGLLDLWANVSAGLSTAFENTTSSFVEAWHDAIQTVTPWFDGLERRQREQEKARIRAAEAAGKITKATADKEIANVDASANGIKAARDKKDEQDAAERANSLKDRIAKIQAERDKRLAENAGNENNLTGAAGENAKKEIADLDAEKKRLEEELKKQTGKAAREKSGGIDTSAPSLVDPSKIDGLDKAIANRQSTDLKSAGVFNVAALQSLQASQASPTQDAIKDATEATAKYTKTIAERPSGFT